MNPWFRFYESALDDPKVQLLPPDLFKFWVNCLCLACRNDGTLPPLHAVSFAFRLPEKSVSDSVSHLVKIGLLDKRNGTLCPHNWHKRQYISDTSTPRVKRFRERFKVVTESVPETPSDTDTDSDTDTEKKGTIPIVPFVAFGEFGQCKLTEDQLSKLKAKLNGHHEAYIEAFDHWVNEAPDARHNGIRRKDRHAYESITSWYNRDVREGKIKTHTKPKTSSQMAADLRSRHGIQ